VVVAKKILTCVLQQDHCQRRIRGDPGADEEDRCDGLYGSDAAHGEGTSDAKFTTTRNMRAVRTLISSQNGQPDEVIAPDLDAPDDSRGGNRTEHPRKVPRGRSPSRKWLAFSRRNAVTCPGTSGGRQRRRPEPLVEADAKNNPKVRPAKASETRSSAQRSRRSTGTRAMQRNRIRPVSARQGCARRDGCQGGGSPTVVTRLRRCTMCAPGSRPAGRVRRCYP